MLPADPEINYVQPTVADIDGDGKAEVIFGTRDGRLVVYRTEMSCTRDNLWWPTANGGFTHTGVWRSPARKRR